MGWVIQQWLSSRWRGWEPVTTQAMRLDASAVSVWFRRVGGFQDCLQCMLEGWRSWVLMTAKDGGSSNRTEKPLSRADTLARYTSETKRWADIRQRFVFWSSSASCQKVLTTFRVDLPTSVNAIKKILSWWDGSGIDTLDKQASQPCSIPRPHIKVEGERWLHRVVFCLHMHTMAHSIQSHPNYAHMHPVIRKTTPQACPH